MALLEVKGIKKRFGKSEILKGIDFDLEKGEVLSIIGSPSTANRFITAKPIIKSRKKICAKSVCISDLFFRISTFFRSIMFCKISRLLRRF